MKKKAVSLLLCTAMVVGLLAGCGSSKGSSSTGTEGAESSAIDTEGKSTDFTMLGLTAITLDQYDDYNDFPAVEYWLDMDWDANGDGTTAKANIDIWAPTAGAEQDYVNTLVSTGDYPDVLNLQYCTQSAAQMYEDGWTLDLTDYIDAYMPNYKAWMAEHPEITFTNTIDGEEKYVQIYSGNYDLAEPWGGLMYRRDWVVNYCTNPETGEAFTGQWVENEDGTKDWEDDVVFPSGNTDPTTISDWEWMFEGFKPVVDQLAASVGYGYCVQLPYEGANLTGDLMSGFGGIGAACYYDEDGNIAFGGDSEGMQAYAECMNYWYSQGWVDQSFAERASDPFYLIDATSIYTGVVGAWYGLQSQLLDGLAGDGSNPLTAGAVVYAAATPINDKYGDASVQNTEPTTYYNGGYLGCGWVITDNAEDKDIATLLTAIDYLFSKEGSLLFSCGLSDEIMANASGDEDWYQKYIDLELPNGAYSMGEDGIPIQDSSLVYDNDNRSEAAIAQRMCGLATNTKEHGYSQTMKNQFAIWTQYEDSGMIQADLTAQLSTEDATSYSTFNSDFTTTVAQWLPLYINGQYDPSDDSDWQNYVDQIQALDPQTQVDHLQAIVDAKNN